MWVMFTTVVGFLRNLSLQPGNLRFDARVVTAISFGFAPVARSWHLDRLDTVARARAIGNGLLTDWLKSTTWRSHIVIVRVYRVQARDRGLVWRTIVSRAAA